MEMLRTIDSRTKSISDAPPFAATWVGCDTTCMNKVKTAQNTGKFVIQKILGDLKKLHLIRISNEYKIHK